jgi:hypothetical protein
MTVHRGQEKNSREGIASAAGKQKRPRAPNAPAAVKEVDDSFSS